MMMMMMMTMMMMKLLLMIKFRFSAFCAPCKMFEKWQQRGPPQMPGTLFLAGHNDLVETDMRAYFGEVCGWSCFILGLGEIRSKECSKGTPIQQESGLSSQTWFDTELGQTAVFWTSRSFARHPCMSQVASFLQDVRKIAEGNKAPFCPSLRDADSRV